MNIAKFCIRHKVTTLLAVIMIAVFGVVYTTQLQMALLPNIEYPAAYVYCYYNGAGPEDIEQLVTRPLESAIMSVPGVDSVTSSSADSISTIQIMYVENTDVDIAATKLREKFDALSLPDGCGSPVILNINVSELMPSAIVGLLGDDLAALQQQAENVVAPALPFTVLGKKLEAGQWEVYLAKGDQTLIVRQGDVIDGLYRVEKVEPPTLNLVYLPLGQSQNMEMGDFE